MTLTTPSLEAEVPDKPSDPSRLGLPVHIQQHLGGLLARIYTVETVEPDAEDRFAGLLTELEHALGQARDRGDSECRKLLLASTPVLRRFALSLTHDPNAADDLVQDTLLRAWKNRRSFTPGTNFEAWTFTILRNQFYSNHRKHREVQDEEGVHAAQLVSPPEQTGHLDVQDVQVALSKLPPLLREALVLVTIEGLSYEGAASIMGCELGTAKSRVWRARERLARLLGYGANEVGNDAIMMATFSRSNRDTA